MEFASGEIRDDLFAGTPPLFAMRLLLSLVASCDTVKKQAIMILDVKCAFLYGKMKRDVYIELPPEDPDSLSGEFYGKLEKAMYGTRDAPQIWQAVVRETMERLGFQVSVLHPAIYYHREKGIRVIAHVDDFLCTGDERTLRWLYNELSK